MLSSLNWPLGCQSFQIVVWIDTGSLGFFVNTMVVLRANECLNHRVMYDMSKGCIHPSTHPSQYLLTITYNIYIYTACSGHKLLEIERIFRATVLKTCYLQGMHDRYERN